MSEKIQQTLDVIDEIRRLVGDDPSSYAVDVRVKATEAIAVKHSVRRQTIEDKFIRWMKPEIQDMGSFNSLVKQLLETGDSSELREVLEKYARGEEDLERINRLFANQTVSDPYLAAEFDLAPTEKVYREGKTCFQHHLSKERASGLVRTAKEVWSQAQGGDIKCEACGFSFLSRYGNLGRDFIEAHHKEPISRLSTSTEVRVDDLVPVCSNCHSMLHRRGGEISISDLKKLLL